MKEGFSHMLLTSLSIALSIHYLNVCICTIIYYNYISQMVLVEEKQFKRNGKGVLPMSVCFAAQQGACTPASEISQRAHTPL